MLDYLFITAGPIAWASSRLRAYWVAECLDNAACVQSSAEAYPEARNYIWQKLVDVERMQRMEGRHFWDVCDPSWWWEPERCRAIADAVDGVVASSPALAQDFDEWHGGTKVLCIPDRFKLSHFHTQRAHAEVLPIRFIWYGVAVNRIALYGALANLDRLAANGYKIELTIMDDRPDAQFVNASAFPIYHTRWQLGSEVATIAAHDIALLPPYPGPWGRVKSNNRALTAYLCGLPWTDAQDYGDLRYMVDDSGLREWLAQEAMKGDLNVATSALEWSKLCSR